MDDAKTVSLYDTDKSKLLNRYENKAAVLSCDMMDTETVCLGGLDCEVKMYNSISVLIDIGMTSKRSRNVSLDDIWLQLVVFSMWNHSVVFE